MTRAILIACIAPALAAAAGHVSYTLETAPSPTSDELAAYAAIRKAMDSAVGYYNRYTSLRKSLHVQYNSGVATADGSSNGTIRFGSSRSYMQVGTAMHEIAHTVGIGTTSAYTALMVGGQWQGPEGIAALKALDGDAAILKGDGMHFWPYGINYESEVKGVATLVGHCTVVQAMYQDMFHERVGFEGRIRSKATGSCMVRKGSALALGSCTDSTSRIALVAMGATDTTWRLEFDDLVLDAPNQSAASGLAMGLYAWNGGAHQTIRVEGGAVASGATVRLRMVHSNLLLKAGTTGVTQEPAAADPTAQTWELVGTSTSVEPRGKVVPARAGQGRHDAMGRGRSDSRSLDRSFSPGF